MNDETFNFEERIYTNPTTSRDEQLEFLDTLRETQGRNTAQIQADTYALGTQLPTQLGGLSGAEQTFQARYQTPQTQQTVADLRTAAQQSALNQALSNLQSAYKKRYNDAMLNYQKRAAASNYNNNNNDKYAGEVNVLNPEIKGDASSGVVASQIPNSTTSVIDGETLIQDSTTGETLGTSKPENHPNAEGWYLTNETDRWGRRIVRNLNNGNELSLEEFEAFGGKL